MSFTYYFNEIAKSIGSYGVTYEEYWFGSTDIVEFKVNAFNATTELNTLQYDMLAWDTGAYVQEAIASAFGKHRYPQKPKAKPKSKLTPESKAVEQFNRLERWRKSVSRKTTKVSSK